MRWLLSGLMALLLVGCNDYEQEKINAGVQLTFAVACLSVENANEAWLLYASKHKISDADRTKVKIGYVAAKDVCTGNAPVTTPDRLAAVMKVISAYISVTKEARSG